MSNQFGATFVPGAGDDYFMPEVVAPSPQRVTPQVPQNMQEDLQRMELEAREVEPRGQNTNHHVREPSLSTWTAQKSHSQALPPAPPKEEPKGYPGNDISRSDTTDSMGPSFSPFPKIKGDNIPPSDDEKEGILWNARKHVLGSQNVSMQITWARDVLNWADIAMEAAARESPDRPRASTPRIEHELRTDAVNIITYLAGQEHPQALYIKAKWLEFGKFGSRMDKREAYNGYKRAAELGNARSEYRIGMLYEQSNDISRAKEHYYQGVSLKDSAALYRLGMMSLLGQLGETKDYQTGLERIKAAADSSDEDSPQGAFVYGMLVGRELPDISIPESMLPSNAQTALMYIEKSAYLGFARAQHKVGQAYELCQFGCDFNPSYSLHYYGLAAKQGNAEAALGVSRWFLFGFEGVFKKNEELAYKYAQQASAAKLATGEFAMGYYHEIGIHVEKSLTEARRWYQIAADHGNKDAIARLESLDEDKTLSKSDHETTTLTRIKSQHGSLRGKRPDRFKQPNQMPTLNEDRNPTPPTGGFPPKPPGNPYGESPRISPQVSPGLRPAGESEYASYPDPARSSAFNIRLDANQPAPRPQSAAPYPVDDRHPPPGASRPKSTAPYPEDGMRGPSYGRTDSGFGPGYGRGPAADRPGSAFGIKSQGPGRPLAASQSMGNLQPPTHGDPRGRVASSGPHPSGGFRQPSPGPSYPRDQQSTRPVSAQPYPSDGPSGGRLQKQPPLGGIPPAGSRVPAGRPVSEIPPQQDPRYGRGGPANAGRPGQNALPQRDPRDPRGPGAGYPGPGPGSNSGHAPSPGPAVGRVGTAPPATMQRPDNRPSPAPSSSSAPAKQLPNKGPSTFEDMGIPQGKQDGDCLVM